LAVCLFILAAAAVLGYSADGEHIKLGRVAVPSICTFKNATGIPCPGCGLTRSLVASVHGNWDASIAYHRLGLVFFFFLVAQVVYRSAWICLTTKRAGIGRVGRFLDLALVPLLLLLFLNWIPTLIGVFSF
jgi:hypothetical protein